MPNNKPKYKKGTPEHKAFLKQIGARGGKTTKFRMMLKDPNYYENIGRRGAEVLMERHGREHFVRAAAIREARKREAAE